MARISKREMALMVDDFATLERRFKDMQNVLAAICCQQDDHTIHIPVTSLQAIPAGTELIASFDRALDQYTLTVKVPEATVEEAVAEELKPRPVYPH